MQKELFVIAVSGVAQAFGRFRPRRGQCARDHRHFPVRVRMVVAIVGAACGFAGCAEGNGTEREKRVPLLLTGEFVDEYGIEYSIGPERWLQHPATRYRIVAWLPGERILVQRDNGHPFSWMKRAAPPEREHYGNTVRIRT